MPDYGNGYFANKLTYEQWFRFSLRVRCGENYIEMCYITCFLILVGGIFAPWVAVGLGVLMWLGRFVYTCGYISSPKGRNVGRIIIFLTMLLLILCALYSVAMLIGQSNMKQERGGAFAARSKDGRMGL
mmetsp:Transcript_41655/g.56587  ORF Transcript_41655/g.56587 Transcript_41655/m.56587 type:complete len:129 (-) Transcript_41655:91-477(-)